MGFTRVFGVVFCAILSASFVSAQGRDAKCSKHWPGWPGVKFLFTFGDSYTHTGFDLKGPQPDMANPLGNPPYPGFTSAAGPNWLDFLTVRYNSSKILAYNMADGGSTLDSTLVTPHRPDAISFRDQIGTRWLGTYSLPKEKNATNHWEPDNTLFAFFIGINDIQRIYAETNRTIVTKLFTEYVKLIEQVYKAGGRNFLFMNVPPLEYTPFTTAAGGRAVEMEAGAVKAWNKDLEEMAGNLPKILPDSTSFVFDTYKLFARILQDPDAYPQTAGLKDTKAFCSAYGFFTPQSSEAIKPCEYALNQYFWINDMHPTYPIHNATAAEVARMLTGQPANTGKACQGDNNNGIKTEKGGAGESGVERSRVYRQYR